MPTPTDPMGSEEIPLPPGGDANRSDGIRGNPIATWGHANPYRSHGVRGNPIATRAHTNWSDDGVRGNPVATRGNAVNSSRNRPNGRRSTMTSGALPNPRRNPWWNVPPTTSATWFASGILPLLSPFLPYISSWSVWPYIWITRLAISQYCNGVGFCNSSKITWSEMFL